MTKLRNEADRIATLVTYGYQMYFLYSKCHPPTIILFCVLLFISGYYCVPKKKIELWREMLAKYSVFRTIYIELQFLLDLRIGQSMKYMLKKSCQRVYFDVKSFDFSGLGRMNSLTMSSVTVFLRSWISVMIGVIWSMASFFRKPVKSSPLV